MDCLTVDILTLVYDLLNEESKTNLMLAFKNARNVLSNSQKRLKNFILRIKRTNYWNFIEDWNFCVPLRNISISYDIGMDFEDIARFILRFQDSLETLELNHFKFNSFNDCSIILNSLFNLKSLKLNDCNLLTLENEALPPIRTLKSLSFIKCDDNIFKIFTKQDSLEKITVQNDDWTWNGFPHDIFNEICRNSKNLFHLVLDGAGTGSYFDCDEFPYRITKLDATMITFNWYVGIRTQRTHFLESQKGCLKELTIHQLPYDFDGGRVLEYIVEEMELDSFYYGKIPLILNGEKQEVEEFSASELQTTSAFEMVKQFTCSKFKLELSKTEIACDEIEKLVNPPTDLFKDVKELEVIDSSAVRSIFGVFLGLLRNLPNLEKLKLKTMDRNINTILECLPRMAFLEEIHLTSTAPRIADRLQAIQKCAPNLKKLSISKAFIKEARSVFQDVEINGI